MAARFALSPDLGRLNFSSTTSHAGPFCGDEAQRSQGATAAPISASPSSQAVDATGSVREVVGSLERKP